MPSFRLFDLNPAQQDAVLATEGPVLILAGAGTGKTRVITARIAYLIHEGVSPSSILAVTFTNKAANEMRERILTMVPQKKASELTIGTFHSLCVRILRSGIEHLGYKSNFTIYTESDQVGLLKKIITRSTTKAEKNDHILIKNEISRLKNDGRTPDPSDTSLVATVFHIYNQELKRLNAVDFDDLLHLAVYLLENFPDIQEHWQARFKYLMVDEFQDTNNLQLNLIRLLAGTPPNVCVVGDDDQSIYSWRGANVSNILDFERYFPNPTVIKLEQNYRSTNAILHTANSLIRNNPRRRPKTLWSQHGDGEPIQLVALEDDRLEAEYVANEIHRLHTIDNIPYESFAVLYRVNAQSRLIEQNLRNLKIPYHLIGGKSFFDRREVKDIMAYAAVILNPEDDINLLRIINTPARGIGATTVELALEYSIKTKTSLIKAFESPDFQEMISTRAKNAINDFLYLLEQYEVRINEPLADYAQILENLIQETGYHDELRRSCKTPEEADSREGNIRDMIAGLRYFQNHQKSGLQGFLDSLALNQDKEDDKEKDASSGVTLITLHAAKGLEFPHVYLIGMEEGVLPHKRSREEGTLDEERRLFYVGITRAMQTLALTHCQTRVRYGEKLSTTPSSFLQELSPDFITHVDYNEVLNTPISDEDATASFDMIRSLLTSKSREADT